MATNQVLVHLEDFFRTGKFGPVRFGITPEELQELLGPDSYGGPATRKGQNHSKSGELYKYGDVEFFFSPEDRRLWCIHMDYFTIPQGDNRLQLEPSWIRGGLPQSEVERCLRESGFEWRQDRRVIIEGVITLQLLSGVRLTIETEEGLTAISCSLLDSPKNGVYLWWPILTKQVGLSLPLDVYDKVREEARSQKTSIAKLCSRWIVERAFTLDQDG